MSSSIPNRYSFYADPRYHDYHRSTQHSHYPPNDYNSNINTQSQCSTTAPHQSPFNNRADSYNNSLPKVKAPTNSSDYAAINKPGSQGRPRGHQRYPSYDSSSAPFQTSSTLRQEIILDYDDPQGAENSLYARVRKHPPVGRSVTNPARV